MTADRVVYDSALGPRNVCAACGKRLEHCACGRRPVRRASPGPAAPPRDGVVRVQRDRKQRGGKVVTVVTGLPATQLAPTASELKRLCGSGGTIKGEILEIQGDHRDRLADVLRARGYTVKLAGG